MPCFRAVGPSKSFLYADRIVQVTHSSHTKRAQLMKGTTLHFHYATRTYKVGLAGFSTTLSFPMLSDTAGRYPTKTKI